LYLDIYCGIYVCPHKYLICKYIIDGDSKVTSIEAKVMKDVESYDLSFPDFKYSLTRSFFVLSRILRKNVYLCNHETKDIRSQQLAQRVLSRGGAAAEEGGTRGV
jgi:hypothetical protein